MTAPIGTDLPGRCTNCGFEPTSMGHRSIANGIATGCTDSGPWLRLGLHLRDEAMAATVQAHPDAADLIRSTIKRHASTGRPFSANTIRAELTSLAPSERPAIGAVMNSCRGLLRKVGEEPSTDPATHGKRVSLWVGRAAA